ncbi:hypothetical protein CR513_44601, partial [Mucuna pruriens]
MKKECPKYFAQCVKKGKFLSLVCSKDCWWSRPPSDDEKFIFVGDENEVALVQIWIFLFFRNNNGSLYQNSNVVCSSSLIDNLYILDIFSSHNEILQANEILKPLDLSDIEVCVECIKGKQTSIRKLISIPNVFKSFMTLIELQLGKKIKAIKSYHGGKYYGRYDGLGEQHLESFALFLKECEIVPQYTVLGHIKENWIQEQLAINLLAMSNALGAISFTIPHQDPFLKWEMRDFLRKLNLRRKRT